MSVFQRLDKVCDISMGQAPSGDAYNFEAKGWPLIAGAGDFGELYPNVKKFTTEASRICNPGDIVLGIRATIGEKVTADGKYCLGRGVAGLRAKPSLNSRYLWHWLTQVRPILASKAKGATFKQVNKEDIGELKIPLPPFSEQCRIAAILDQADALRAKRREALAQLDSLSRSIFIEMFGEHANFPTYSLNELCDLITDGTHQTPEYAEKGITFLSAKNVTSGYIDWKNIKHIPESLHLELHRRLAPKLNDILLAKNGTTGVAALVDRECVFDIYVSLALLRPKKDMLPIYLLGAINSPLCTKQFKGALKGIGVPNLHLKEIRLTKVPKPPLEIQREFSRRIEAINMLKIQHQTSLMELDNLFASLQHRAFRGEL